MLFASHWSFFYIFLGHEARAMKTHDSWSDDSALFAGTSLCLESFKRQYRNKIEHVKQVL